MTRRDEFPQSVKDNLAYRAGDRCSYPGCPAVTAGPSYEHAQAKANTGQACHIAAASDGAGARRFDPNMTREQRISIENGIWMCAIHGKLIDTDAVRFTVDLLKQWRARAEHNAAIRQAVSQIDHSNSDLFKYDISINHANLSEETLAHALDDAAVSAFWGLKQSYAIRDFIFELAQNALTHGRATSFEVRFSPKCIVLEDDGCCFDPRALGSDRRGGTESMRALRRVLGDRLNFCVSQSGGNLYTLEYIRSFDDITSVTPCHLDSSNFYPGMNLPDASSFSECEIVYVLLHRYMAFSKAFALEKVLGKLGHEKQLVLVCEGVSDDVKDILAEIPSARILDLGCNNKAAE